MHQKRSGFGIPDGFVPDPESGYYFSADSGYYYDASTKLFYHPSTEKWCDGSRSDLAGGASLASWLDQADSKLTPGRR